MISEADATKDTVTVIPCSQQKDRPSGSSLPGPSILDDLPQVLADQLSGKPKVAPEAKLDERSMIPAWKRCHQLLLRPDGSGVDLYNRTICVAESADLKRRKYGVVRAEESIGWYDRELKQTRLAGESAPKSDCRCPVTGI